MRKKKNVSPLPSSIGRLEQAKRFALMNFDNWNAITNVPPAHSGYYYEVCKCIEDAVEFGFGVAHGQPFQAIKKRIKGAK